MIVVTYQLEGGDILTSLFIFDTI